MADFSSRTVITTRKEVTLELPSNWAELGKALAYVRSQRPDNGREWDDTVRVTADEEQITFSWDVPKEES